MLHIHSEVVFTHNPRLVGRIVCIDMMCQQESTCVWHKHLFNVEFLFKQLKKSILMSATCVRYSLGVDRGGRPAGCHADTV